MDFAHSVHDFNGFSCNDCHGGNTEDDVEAHEAQFDFIGTKPSAHIKNCTECHEDSAEHLDAGPHHWDWQKRINTEYPMCIDCHGNHDVARPPSDFLLKDVCEDCRKDFKKDYPPFAAIVDQNDRLWQTIIKVQEKQGVAADGVVPKRFREERAKVRESTMELIHGLEMVSAEKADELNRRAERLRQEMVKWLESEE